MSQVLFRNTRAADASAILALTCLTYNFNPDNPGEFAVTPQGIRAQTRRFAEGQFVATLDGQVIGYTITLRTRRSPEMPALNWGDATGGPALSNHHLAGDWLYIVDFAVHPEFRGFGIGKQLCQAWFDLVKRLNLRGIYAGGLLTGYHEHAHRMSVDVYGDAVRCGALNDPTVSMYMKRGFKIGPVIKNYEGTSAHDQAMLIVWRNPYYRAVYQAQHQYQAQW